MSRRISIPLAVLVSLWLAIASVVAQATAQPPTPTAPQATPRAATPIAVARPACTFGQVGHGDAYFPTMGNGGYDVEHYDLELDIDVAAASINIATATIEALAIVDLCAFNLDFEGLTIDGITVNGDAATHARHGKELTITPSAPLAAGETFSVEVRYHGMPIPASMDPEQDAAPARTDLANGIGGADPGETPVIRGGWFVAENEIFTLGEPTGNRFWYPVNEHPADKATYSTRYTVPDPFVVVSNGQQVDEIDHGDTITYAWASRDPIASYLVIFHAGMLELERMQGPNGLPILISFSPNVPESQRALMRTMPEMLAFAESIYGPYPFESFGGTVTSTRQGLALETQTLPVYGSLGESPEAPVSEGELAYFELTIFHELTHQWFGDSVSVQSWRDVWLSEGFAAYSEALWLEHAYGIEARDELLREYASYAGMADQSPDGVVLTGDPGGDELFSYSSIYSRGALTVHALRTEVGDEAFFAILQAWTARHVNGNAATADFIALAESVSGQDLDDFFRAWLFEPMLPALDLS